MAKCGYRTGLILDETRPNWEDTARRPIAWSAWYPTTATYIGDSPLTYFFDLGDVILNAPLISRGKLPVVMLSHGTGGTAESLGWLARALACEGYVVIGANHHGNSGMEPYLAQGFLCWWERATDLSVFMTSLKANGFFSDRLDCDRVAAVGFSLGGHTVMALAGGQTSIDEFDVWRKDNNITAGGPTEFPDAADHIPRLLKTSKAFRHSRVRHGDDVSDDRISSAIAIAPAPPARSFTAQPIAQLRVPLTILTGSADQEAPSEHCANWIIEQNNHCTHYDLGRNVNHCTFLEWPTDRSLVGQVDIFTDHSTVNRAQVHEKAAKLVLTSLI